MREGQPGRTIGRARPCIERIALQAVSQESRLPAAETSSHRLIMCIHEDGPCNRLFVDLGDCQNEQVAKGRYKAMDRRTVLVVEDDAAIRALVVGLLDDAGYTVLEADRGKKALRLAEEHVPSVVLVDHKLPDMSGLDLLERLRMCRASRYIPVMLVSGLAHQLVDRHHGTDRVLAKSFDINVLLEQVASLASVTRDGVA